MLRKQDLRVDIVINEAKAPEPNIVFELGVVALDIDPSPDNEIFSASGELILSKDELATYVAQEDLNELENGFVEDKPVYLWTIKNPADIKDILENIETKVKTILLTSSVSEIVGNDILDFNGITIYTATSTTPYEDEAIKNRALTQKNCVFSNSEKDGKVLYTFSKLLGVYPNLTQQTTIENASFSSVFETKTQRDLLINNGISFWMNSKSGAFLFDVYAGNKQIQSVYSYFILEEEVAKTIDAFISRGQSYTNTSIKNLEGEVASTLSNLKGQNIISGYNIEIAMVEQQLQSNKIKGIVANFSIEFNEAYRMALVKINIQGELG